METVQKLSENTFVVRDGPPSQAGLCVLKEIGPDDLPAYKKLTAITSGTMSELTGFVTLENRLFVKRPYVHGVSLEEYVEKSGPLTDGEVKVIVGDLS